MYCKIIKEIKNGVTKLAEEMNWFCDFAKKGGKINNKEIEEIKNGVKKL